jgi:hypothetical protein
VTVDAQDWPVIFAPHDNSWGASAFRNRRASAFRAAEIAAMHNNIRPVAGTVI